MTPIDIGLAASESVAPTVGGGDQYNNQTSYGPSPVAWIAAAAVALVGMVLWLKLR
jgi:hypothetical protein